MAKIAFQNNMYLDSKALLSDAKRLMSISIDKVFHFGLIQGDEYAFVVKSYDEDEFHTIETPLMVNGEYVVKTAELARRVYEILIEHFNMESFKSLKEFQRTLNFKR